MPFDAFLKIDVIPGESRDEKHLEWIELLSYHHSVTSPRSGSRASDLATGRREYSDLSIVKTIDKATPLLFDAVATNKSFATVKLELCRATGAKDKYCELLLEDVFVSSVRPGGTAAEGKDKPLEEVSFNYQKITMTYFEVDPKTGQPKGQVSFTDSTSDNQ